MHLSDTFLIFIVGMIAGVSAFVAFLFWLATRGVKRNRLTIKQQLRQNGWYDADSGEFFDCDDFEYDSTYRAVQFSDTPSGRFAAKRLRKEIGRGDNDD